MGIKQQEKYIFNEIWDVIVDDLHVYGAQSLTLGSNHAQKRHKAARNEACFYAAPSLNYPIV